MRVRVKVAGIWVVIDVNPRELLMLLSFAFIVKDDLKGTVVTRFNDLEGTGEFWSLNPSVVKSNL